MLLSSLRRDYPNRVVISHAYPGAGAALVHLAHSWLLFRLTSQGGFTYASKAPAVFRSRPDRAGVAC